MRSIFANVNSGATLCDQQQRRLNHHRHHQFPIRHESEIQMLVITSESRGAPSEVANNKRDTRDLDDVWTSIVIGQAIRRQPKRMPRRTLRPEEQQSNIVRENSRRVLSPKSIDNFGEPGGSRIFFKRNNNKKINSSQVRTTIDAKNRAAHSGAEEKFASMPTVVPRGTSEFNLELARVLLTACSLKRRSIGATRKLQHTAANHNNAPKPLESSRTWFLFLVAIFLPSIALLPLFARTHSTTTTNGKQLDQLTGRQQEFVREMSDLLTLSPPFAPTRRPQATTSEAFSKSARVGSSRALVVSAGGQSEPAESSQTERKFVRTNELDTYLDDMNQNELRTVASGRPIEDLFNATPMHQGALEPPGMNLSSAASAANRKRQNRRREQATQDGGGGGLMGSHSEQQIYSECALILQRTYVKSIDDPKHQLVPFGKTEQACISYKHIDKAIEQAKHKLKFREFAKMRQKPLATGPGKPPLAPLDVIHSTLEPPEDLVAAIGEINMATTQIIADQFDLSNDELLNGLPLIDMSKTKFWDLCPLLVKQDLKCELTRFRTPTGHCNNLKHPTWGAAMTPFARYLPPVHPDGIWIARKSIVSEITFELGEGHRETHSNIAPSMPAPVFNGGASGAPLRPPALMPALPSLGGEPSAAHLHLQHAHAQAQAVRAVHFGSLAGDAHLRPMRPALVGSPPVAFDENHFSTQRGNGFLNEPLEQAASVQFVSSKQLDEEHDEPTIHHYQSSHSPMTPFAASSHRARLSEQPLNQESSLQHGRLLSHHRPTRAVAQELPSARLVTSVVHRDMEAPAHDLSILFMSWGQLLDHDMTRAAQPPSSIKCCPQADGTPPSGHKLCLPINVAANDPFYAKFGVRCLEFRRTLAGVRPNCVLGPRVHQNAITAPIDANFVYGSSQAMANGLRLFREGRLRERDWFRHEGLKPLLPAQELEPDLECIARPKDLFCFLAGDVRANEQTHLTVLHTLYMREHNRLAERLAELNPHWDDERIYQETRHIVAAGVQHVMINEYLPLLIGRKMGELYNLTAQPAEHDQRAYWHGYDPSVTTSVANSFAAGAFRQGHTFVQGSIERYNKFHEFVASEKLRHLFKQPFLLYQPGVLDELTSGMINQASQQYDPFISEDISGHLFQPPELQFGHDLAAINLQRGREQGLPGYNLFREWCGLPRAESFDQLEPYLTNRTAYHYSRLYKHVDDIDLWSGGVSERKLPGAAIGPTFACIIARQFSNTRRGDRFWYENPGLPSSFTPDQLAEIRKISLAKILCANSDDLPTIQRWVFRLAHPVLNPRLDCNQLPEMDLQYWQEE